MLSQGRLPKSQGRVGRFDEETPRGVDSLVQPRRSHMNLVMSIFFTVRTVLQPQKIFYILGMRTQYSHALKNELDVAIPGYTKFIKYIKDFHYIHVFGWKH